jgi:hypothetical protein
MKRTDLVKLVLDNLGSKQSASSGSKIKIMKSRDLDLRRDDADLIKNFIDVCCSVMELEGNYKCYLSASRQKSKIKTSAICSFNDNNIRVYCKDRAVFDILRSIAHEMLHLRQHELDLVHNTVKKHYLNPIEWDANVVAGSILSFFALKVGRDRVYR